MVRLDVKNQVTGEVVTLDTLGDEVITIKKSASEIQDITRRKGSYTQPFSLPFTKTNNEFFEFFNEYGQTPQNFKPNKNTFATVYEHDIPIFSGILKYSGADLTKKLHKVTVIDKFSQLITALGEDTMADLFGEYTELDHVISRTQVVNSWGGGLLNLNNVLKTEIRYPLIDWGYGWEFSTDPNAPGFVNSSNRNAIECKQLRPCVQLYWIIKKMFERAGFLFQSTFLESALFKDIYVAIGNQPELTSVNEQEVFKATKSANQIVTVGSSDVIEFDTEDYDINNAWNTTTDEYTTALTGDAYFELKLDLSFSSNQVLIVIVEIDNGTGYVESDRFTVNFGSAKTNLNYSKKIYFLEGVSAADKVRFKFENLAGSNITIKDSSTLTLVNFYPIDDQTIEMRYNASDKVKQSDFLRAIFERFNIWTDDINGKELRCETFSDWVDSGETYDITDFINQEESINIQTLSDVRNRQITFQDKVEKNFYGQLYEKLAKRVYGSKELIIDDEFADGEKEIYTVFEAPVQYKIRGSELITLSSFERDDETGAIKPRATEMMLCFLRNETTPSDNTFPFYDSQADNIVNYNNVMFASSFSNVPFTSTSFDLNFQLDTFFYQSLIPTRGLEPDVYTRHWTRYLAQIYSNESKFVKLQARLDTLFFQKFRLNDKLIIENVNWRVNKLSYTTDGETTMELIKLLGFAPQLETCAVIPTQYNADGTISFINSGTGTVANPTKECCEKAGGIFAQGVGESRGNVCLWQKGKDVQGPSFSTIKLLKEYDGEEFALTTDDQNVIWPNGQDEIKLPNGNWNVEITMTLADTTLYVWRYTGFVIVAGGVHSGSIFVLADNGSGSNVVITVTLAATGITVSARRTSGSGNFNVNFKYT